MAEKKAGFALHTQKPSMGYCVGATGNGAPTKTRLTAVEKKRLAELEAIADRGMGAFIEVGLALIEIKESQLYRDSHATFEDYTRERFGVAHSRANQLMKAAATVNNLLPDKGHTSTVVEVAKKEGITSERQIRPLTEVEPEQQQEVWAEAKDAADGPPTAKQVEVAAAKRKPKATHVCTCPTCGHKHNPR